MSTALDDLCVVCGATTTQYCSACKEESGFLLPLCSKSCQKLAWSAHKQVCGVNADPFVHPALTSKEVEQLKKHGQDSVRDESGSIMSISAGLAGMWGCAEEQIPTYLDACSCKLSNLEPLSMRTWFISVARGFLRDRIQFKLSVIATDMFEGWKFDVDSSVAPPELFDPLLCLAQTTERLLSISQCLPDTSPLRFHNEEWFCRIQHAILIWFVVRKHQHDVLIDKGCESAEAVAELRVYHDWQQAKEQRMRAYISEVASASGRSVQRRQLTLDALEMTFDKRWRFFDEEDEE